MSVPYLVTAQEMRACDERTIRSGVPSLLLMERAGQGIVSVLQRCFRPLAARRIWIVCGRGNNGGDGLVVARRLHDLGYNPRVLLTNEPDEFGGDAGVQIAWAHRRGIVLERWDPDHFVQLDRLEEEDLLVDAILGTGFQGTIRGEKAEIVEAMNGSRASIVAVDVPSGVAADTGAVDGPAILADRTVTMAYPKRSFLFWPARGYVGEWTAVDIGIPEEVAAAVRPAARLVTARAVSRAIPGFPRTAHKGTRGKVLIAGGSPGLTGAVCMA
ncbi:MAG: NAD(P)H-hydrate epimerase, partial [Candidatus Eisenbacteria bacterium]|nr:NAD(P)H-hydrate epimerase [Candidatus Latescibacterota bacterium]MBD3302358.1 NAD(P)H-hydrate epimerase [Candidatus Eisenbacteria bacterium]